MFLEVPKTGTKHDITGRSNFSSTPKLINQIWDLRRIVNLPIYIDSQDSEMDQFKKIIKYWKEMCISEDVPCIAISIKCYGTYDIYSHREAQSVKVLLVWSDSVARVISFDMYEGPLEDCITPEWYLNTTPLMSLGMAKNLMRSAFKNNNWSSPNFSIYPIPSILGHRLHDNPIQTPYKNWKFEWNYLDLPSFSTEIEILLSEVDKLFREKEGERNGNDI